MRAGNRAVGVGYGDGARGALYGMVGVTDFDAGDAEGELCVVEQVVGHVGHDGEVVVTLDQLAVGGEGKGGAAVGGTGDEGGFGDVCAGLFAERVYAYVLKCRREVAGAVDTGEFQRRGVVVGEDIEGGERHVLLSCRNGPGCRGVAAVDT